LACVAGNDIVERIKAVGLDITEEGELEDFLGINIDRIDGNTYHLSQPQLIDQIIQDLHLNQRLFSAVWSMKRKRRVTTREVYKHKARLNLDGSQMQPGKGYDLTYAPVATWESIRVLLAPVLRYDWKTKQLDYILANKGDLF
jgi:hypothetical protein